MSDIRRYAPWPQEWPQEDPNGDLVEYEDHKKIVDALKARAEAAEAEVEKLRGRIEAMESLRPIWAHGWTDDSVAAQASGSALAQLWQMLGASNQTEAVTKLRAALPDIDTFALENSND